MLETINYASQSLVSQEKIAIGSVSIFDTTGAIGISNNDEFRFYKSGKYKIHGIFNVTNTDSSAVTATIKMFANGNQIGIPVSTYLVATNGADELVIDKIINVLPSRNSEDVVRISFETVNAFNVTSCLIEVYAV